MTMGTPITGHRLQRPALAALGVLLAATAVWLSSSSPSAASALWVGVCGVAAILGRISGTRQAQGRSRDEQFQQALIALQAQPDQQPGAHLVAKAFQHSASPMVITDALDRILVVNQAFTQLIGMDSAALLGQSAELCGMPPLRASHLQGIDQALRDGSRWSGEATLSSPDGQAHELWLVVSTLRDADQRITHHTRAFQNVEPLKAQLRQMSEQARHDSLTGLPNRRAFSEHLFQAMARTRRYPKTLALMSVDLDGFKAVNDNHGHDVGDLLLQHVAKRLMACVRTTDIVCRLGGDEFMVILEGAGMPHEVERVGQRILNCLSEAYALQGQHITATPSIGVVIHHVDETESDLLRRADAAMYAAKHAGKSRMVLDSGTRAVSPPSASQAA